MKIFGKYRGIVVDNVDPEKKLRLKVKVPSLFGDEAIGWAEPVLTYGGFEDVGFVLIPPIGAGVWIEFEGGDVSKPIWSGFWASETRGIKESPGHLRTKYGNMLGIFYKGTGLYIDVSATNEKIGLMDKRGSVIELNNKGKKEVVMKDDVKTVLKNSSENVAGDKFITVKGRKEENVLGTLIQKIAGAFNLAVGDNANITIGGILGFIVLKYFELLVYGDGGTYLTIKLMSNNLTEEIVIKPDLIQLFGDAYSVALAEKVNDNLKALKNLLETHQHSTTDGATALPITGFVNLEDVASKILKLKE